jgi:hypothetical protein
MAVAVKHCTSRLPPRHAARSNVRTAERMWDDVVVGAVGIEVQASVASMRKHGSKQRRSIACRNISLTSVR